MEEITITIVGAGVVGLAIASELSKRHADVVVLEKHIAFGQETSSRNSEVIHSGIYYPCGSLKARLCVEGAERLYKLADKFSIPYKKIGKLIIATEETEIKVVEELFKQGTMNDVRDLKLMNSREVKAIEPNTNGIFALYSPNTGIVDSHSLMKYFYSLAKTHGVLFSFNTEVNSIEKGNEGFIVGVKKDNYKLKSEIIINCAGLASDHIASLAGIDISKNAYKIKYCKGSYFSYAKQSPVNMLVYPVPHEELVGLGIHATLDLGNRLRFGPDAEYIETIDYKIDKSKKEFYYKGASKIIPGLEEEAFMPDMVGIRPKLSGPGEKTRDFIIKHEAESGFEGLINLIGIESPGLSACPAIANMVAGMVDEIMN